ncbi:MAG TPA: NrfD/PsrC family molybdoenzyme membrane anchor subunit [Ktedonobacteraceae bacterium]|nr:NrfD/PsrC family molybdoenzyme membrane anchor subunit [Ktedonobacteraceae bacterium]
MDEIRLPTLIESTSVDNLLEKLVPDQLAENLATLTTGYTPVPDQEQNEPTYYDYPVLKEPFWGWEIIWYFFFGGLAAGCYIIASLAALFGSREDRATARTGYYLSLLALLPCPALLIKDLGRPDRFLNMLRMFKVKSPMSTGVRFWRLNLFARTLSLLSAILCLTADKTGNLTTLYTHQY